MRLIKPLCSFSLLTTFFLACATRNDIAVTTEPATPAPKVSEIKIELSEPAGATGKISWIEYQSGAKALEEEDLLTAMQFFDLALNSVHSEQRADSLGQPEDSLYYSVMPRRIIFVLETLYPRLASLADSEQDLSARNDYEDSEVFDYELLDSFEETPIDSTEKLAIKHFLDTIDLSKFSLPIVINERVMQEIHYLTVNARTFTEGSLSRKTLLDSMIYSKIRERNMPEDLIYLAFIESGFKTSAYSRAKAAGVWQFIPGTGKRYGLSSDFWVDMRRNPELATDAALSYLSELYEEFGDWHLAMAAYNCGEGRIRRLVREKLAENPSLKKVSYWDLKLPRETMHYVPRILAAAIVGHFPEHYSFEVQKLSRAASDTVTIKDCLPLDKIGAAVGMSVNAIRDLNPELVRWCTPPNLKSYTLRVPEGSREKFLAAYEKMDKTQLVRWQQYKVQRGDNLGSISRLFGLRVADVQAANNLKNTKLRVGQTLIIPMPTGANPPKQKQQLERAENLAKPSSINSGGDNPRSYVVRKGDNLSSISRRFGISSQNLQAWNNLQGNKIMVGQRIYLQNPAKKDSKKNDNLAGAASRSISENASYTIKAGDNLWEIAKMNNVTVQQLLEWNPGLDKKIYPGMRIKVKE